MTQHATHLLRRRRPAAFTLVELLIAVALGSIILIMIAQIFSGASKVFTVSDQQTETYNSVRVVFDIMEEQLESVAPQWAAPSGGTPASIKNTLWGLKSDGTDAGVNYELRIRYYDPNAEDISNNKTGVAIAEYSLDTSTNQLMWRFHPAPATVTPPWDFTSATTRIAIIDKVSAFSVEYRKAYRNSSSAFESTWPVDPSNYAAHLPLAVKVTIEVAGVKTSATEDAETLRFMRIIHLPTGPLQNP